MLNSQILSGLGFEFSPAQIVLGPEVVNASNLTTYNFTLTMPETHRAADLYVVLAHFKASTSIYPNSGAHTLGGKSVTMTGWPGTNTGKSFLAAANNLRVYAPESTTLAYSMTWALAGCTWMSARLVGLYNCGCSLGSPWTCFGSPPGYTGISGLGTGGLGGTSNSFRLRAGEQLLLSSNAPASGSIHTWAVTGASYGAVPLTYAVQGAMESGVGYRSHLVVTIPEDDDYTLSLTRVSGTDYFTATVNWVTSGRT